MRLPKMGALLFGLATTMSVGCENKKDPAEAAGEQAEQVAQERAKAAGEGPLDRHVAGEVAEERAELAVDVGARDAEVKRLEQKPAETAAEDLAKPDSGAYR
jgi:hypothetical protein